MNSKELKEFLDLSQRDKIYFEILKKFEDLNGQNHIKYWKYKIPNGYLPVISIESSLDSRKLKYVKVFIGAQHNEYNGLFGILDFLQKVKKNSIEIDNDSFNNQILLFFPLMNVYGFLYPQENNKSGYYLKNGSNLNRFWRKTFVPQYHNPESDLNKHEIPEQTKIVKNILQPYWDNQNVAIYIMDFHETSLMDRFMTKLSLNLKQESYTYKFTHWLEEKILLNIIKLNNLKISHRDLFFKCNPNSDHKHINLTIREVDIVYEKLLNYIAQNKLKIPFYFCYTNRSKEYCQILADRIYHKLKAKLWETLSPAYPHDFHNLGCFVNMSKDSTRKQLYAMELESKKHFFDIFEEIKSSQSDPYYFDKKLNLINISIELVNEVITEMIKIY